MHRCSYCRTLKAPSGFYRDPRRRNGLTSECRACRAAYKRGTRPSAEEVAVCDPCRDRRHGAACAGCACRCRAFLGLDGPFPFGDPTAPGPFEIPDPDEDQVA